MNKKSTTDSLLPLENLVNISQGQTEVRINVGLLPKVDVTNLKYTVKFALQELPYIEVNLVPVSSEITCKVYVATSRRDWPDQRHYAVYHAVLYAAAKRQLQDGPDEDDCTFVRPRKAGMLKFEFSMAKPVSGNAILARLRRKVDGVFDEMHRMLQVIGEGPNPDKYVRAALKAARAKLKNNQ